MPRTAGPLKNARISTDENHVSSLRLSPGRLGWLVVVSAMAALTALSVFGPLGDGRWENPQLLFSLVTVAALTCVIGSTVVIALADRREMAEIGLLGTALMAASVMPLVRGLVTPDVLFEETAAFRTSAFLSLPIAVAVAAPLLRSRSSFGRWAARHWRDWALLSLVGVFVIASIVVFFPDAIVVPGPTDPMAILVSIGMMAALGALSVRQLRFYELGRRSSNLIASLSIALLSVTALLPMVDTPYSTGFWWMHIAGSLGVIGACIGMGVSKRMSRSAQDILAPVLIRDPLSAFELGLSPLVHQFVADLERKDQITRDHTIRTGEMAMRVGERFRMSARDMRDLGLAAMLHDVGKLRVPHEILTKPSRLTVDEYEVIKLHTIHGEEMLAADPSLASAASIVRSHHERIDGRGYPDGLAGRDIPLASRIIAVCDAFDAMTHDRQYRTAMSVKMAHAVLREHSGSQWDPTVIEQVMAVLPTMPTVSQFDEVGRGVEVQPVDDAVPADISEFLAVVDAEI